MTLDFNTDDKLKANPFGRLLIWYVLALTVIASIAIAGQLFIQNKLNDHLSDSGEVNHAGTQRYKSQQIVKLSLLIYSDIPLKDFPGKTDTLRNLLGEWRRSYFALQKSDTTLQLSGQNSARIAAMFRDLDPYFENIYASAEKLIAYREAGVVDREAYSPAMQTMLGNETIFLAKMDRIVSQYEQESRLKVANLGNMGYLFLAVSIIVILLEIFFVFRPTTARVNKTVNQLIASEKNAKKLSKEIGALYASLENSYHQLSQVNEPVETPRVYAKADRGGNVTSVLPLFSDLSGIRIVEPHARICDLFPGAELGDDWMDEVIETVADEKSWQNEIRFTNLYGEEKWVDVIVNPVFGESDIEELIVLGSDITKRKHAEKNMVLKNRNEIEKKINQQKFRSVLILEGQEEERKRLAMDIHDGIGQMLTSLKYQMESVNPGSAEDTAVKLKDVKELISQVIKEIRRITFNLKPTVLGDYGIQAALNVFVREIGKLTDIRLAYHVSGEMSRRLPQQVENNMFRIVQEAINNAIKYADVKNIDIYFDQSEEEIVVTVKDEGKGFDEKLITSRSMNIESGRGFFNMFERAQYINSKLEIKSAPGKGTTVTLTVPVHKAAIAELN